MEESIGSDLVDSPGPGYCTARAIPPFAPATGWGEVTQIIELPRPAAFPSPHLTPARGSFSFCLEIVLGYDCVNFRVMVYFKVYVFVCMFLVGLLVGKFLLSIYL